MNRVFVLDQNEKSLMPTHPARARQLLKQGRARVYRRQPFTIQLLDREGGATQPLEVRIDPGSRTTGLALVARHQRGDRVVWAAELHHRGPIIKHRLDQRRAVRRSRRQRQCRYRPARFQNRRRPPDWLPPSLLSRVNNIAEWVKRLRRYACLSSAAVETTRFDTQKMEHPEISGVEYQQGTLQGYTVREYLLEKWGRQCVYCGATGVPLQVEHLRPQSRGGSNRVHNLAISCGPCNKAKDTQTAAEFGFPYLEDQAHHHLRDAAIVNATRYRIGDVVQAQLPTTFWSGARTKWNRLRQGYEKAHYVDAACVSPAGAQVYIPEGLQPLHIKAVGRGNRQMCKMDRHGFPRSGPKTVKRVQGFQTGDLVKAVVPRGKYQGVHIGTVSVRARGTFRVGPAEVSWRNCRLLQRADGYEYATGA
ncbi:MAG: HNH endonuclease [Chloroflexi bacterium]|nr:HNH endonuclease [Chloroflexota bacterium]